MQWEYTMDGQSASRDACSDCKNLVQTKAEAKEVDLFNSSEDLQCMR